MDLEDDGPAPMMANGADDPVAGDRPTARAAAAGGEPLDVEAYAGLYSGRTRVARLVFVADQCVGGSAQLEALRMAHDEIKRGEDVQLYREVVQKIGGRLGPAYDLDHAWLSSVGRRADLRKEKLDAELNGYKVDETLFVSRKRKLITL